MSEELGEAIEITERVDDPPDVGRGGSEEEKQEIVAEEYKENEIKEPFDPIVTTATPNEVIEASKDENKNESKKDDDVEKGATATPANDKNDKATKKVDKVDKPRQDPPGSSAAEVETPTKQTPSSPRQNDNNNELPKWLYLLAGFLGGATVVGVILGVVLGNQKLREVDDDLSPSSGGGMPTMPTTNNPQPPSGPPAMNFPPTANPSLFANFSEIVGDFVFLEGSQQYQAANYVVEQLSGADPPTDDSIQRFLLTLFYYQTSDNGNRPWRSCNIPDPSEGEETCFFERFVGREPNNGTLSFTSNPSFRWLSRRPACDWAGVECDSTAKVTSIELGGQNLTGTLPSEIAELTSLTKLELFFNELSGTLPPSYNRIKELHLHYNMLYGSIPQKFFSAADELILLNIGSNMITGEIPSDIGDASNLAYFYFFDNDITGGFPPIGNTKMKELRGQNNKLAGNIGDDIGELRESLEVLWLHGNELSGALSDSFGKLLSLTDLRLTGNKISGEIPFELFELTQLEILHLGNMFLTGEINSRIGQLTNLMSLELNGNELNGMLPTEMGLLKKLETLQLQGNEFSGMVPNGVCDIGIDDLIADCSRLSCSCCTQCCDGNDCLEGAVSPFSSYLEIFSNVVGGAVFEMSSLQASAARWLYNEDKSRPKLDDDNLVQRYLLVLFYYQTTANRTSQWLYCNPPGASSSTSCVFMNMTEVNDVYERDISTASRWLSSSPECEWSGITCDQISGDVIGITLVNYTLTGVVPTELAMLTTLESLDLSLNKLAGTIPTELSRLTNMKSLHLAANGLFGTLSSSLLLPKLTTLNISDNSLEGPILRQLNVMQDLTDLRLEKNNFSGPLPSLLELGKLKRLYVNQNFLSGTIPETIYFLTSLQQLHISANRLTGTIPSELGLVTGMLDLQASSNGLRGFIPTELANLANLRDLRLENNQLTGTLPTELFLLSELTRLDLQSNRLSATISEEIGRLTLLQQLRLNQNIFVGTVPRGIAELFRLEILLLDRNNLLGDVPVALCDFPNLEMLVTDCVVECACCTSCVGF